MAGKVEEGLFYSKEHEWVRISGETLEIGITDHAQDSLGDIVFFDVKTQGQELKAGDVFGFIESVKAVEDLYMPVNGVISAVNDDLKNDSSQINQKPYQSWLVKITQFDKKELEANLMDAKKYADFSAS